MPETCIRFGKHGARVKIEDEEIQHYDIQVDRDEKEVTCWIASEAGKAFSIVWLELDVNYPTACNLYLDGHHVDSFMRRTRERVPLTIEQGIISESSSAPFIFSPLDVTDDDDYLDTPSSVGEIKLVICHTSKPRKSKKKGKRKQDDTLKPALPDLEKVHERKKMGVGHRVSYGDEIATPLEEWQTEVYSLNIVKELVTFIFRYRPLEILRANGIVPRNPVPLESQKVLDTPPSSGTSSGKGEQSKVKKEAESGSELDDDDNTREKALLAEVQRCQTEVERIRKGRELKDSERPKKKLKKEDNLKPGPFFTPGEIIDLT